MPEIDLLICDKCGTMLVKAYDLYLKKVWVCQKCCQIVEPKPLKVNPCPM